MKTLDLKCSAVTLHQKDEFQAHLNIEEMSFRVALQGVPAKQLEGKLDGDIKGPKKIEEAALYMHIQTECIMMHSEVFFVAHKGCSFNHWCMQLRVYSGSSCQ